MTELARFTALKAPMPEFIPISLRIGPFTRSMAPKAVVEGMSAVCLVEAMASITGKCPVWRRP